MLIKGFCSEVLDLLHLRVNRQRQQVPPKSLYRNTYLPSCTRHHCRQEEGVKAGTNYRGPTILQMFLSFSIEKFNPSRPNPSRPATDSQPFRFSVQILAGPPLLGGWGWVVRWRNLFHRGPNLLSAILGDTHQQAVITIENV